MLVLVGEPTGHSGYRFRTLKKQLGVHDRLATAPRLPACFTILPESPERPGGEVDVGQFEEIAEPFSLGIPLGGVGIIVDVD